MPNKNYLKGRRKEYSIKWKLEELGMIALRSAGSHSPIDVIGIDKERKIIKLIQCKPASMSEKAKQAIVEQNKGLQGHFIVTFEVI